ncbi:MAG: ankyrin repeat domain-containing protein [Gammaproteobacteria bacterium]
MNAKFKASVIVAAAMFASTALFAQTSGNNSKEPDKPIMYMTPAELFSDPQLRALAEAAQHGNVKKIDALIAKGINVNGKGKFGITPLFSAAQAGSKVGFKALLDRGANPNNVWANGYTLMNTIAESSHDPYFMEEALRHGGNPNLFESGSDKTPLIAAVTVSGKVNIPALIKAGANLNYQMPVGKETAIIWAVLDGQFDVVYELLKAGANYGLEDNRGWKLENYIKFSFRANVGSKQNNWRNRVIEFLKQYNAWSEGDG